MTVIYKSANGRTVTIGTYVISADPGIQFEAPVEVLEALVGDSLVKESIEVEVSEQVEDDFKSTSAKPVVEPKPQKP